MMVPPKMLLAPLSLRVRMLMLAVSTTYVLLPVPIVLEERAASV